jgi:hypothetical protein
MKCFAELTVLLKVILHPLRDLFFCLGVEHGAAVVVLVDLVARKDNQIRIMRDHL